MVGNVGRVTLFLSLASIAISFTLENESEVKKSYAGYKLLATSPLSGQEMAASLSLELDGEDGVELWNAPKSNLSVNILVAPEKYQLVKDILEGLGTEHHVMLHDVQEHIEKENQVGPLTQSKQSSGHRMTWTSYHRYEDIFEYCSYISDPSNEAASGATVTMEIIGKTYENRDMIMMKLTDGSGTEKPAIWLDGGMHAREWISPATVTYILNLLVTDRERSAELLSSFDWYINPVANPDGYEYSHRFNRLWRKNRARNRFSFCRGVDQNRNWGYRWGGEGSSSRTCADTYRGPRAFSELETRALSQAILDRRDQIKMYLSFHAYSQLLLVPWSGQTDKPDDYDELYDLAMKGAEALEATNGTKYQVGTAPDLIYVAAGGSDDWAKGGAGIKYSYTFELRDTGRYGFLLPADQIIPTGEETFNAVKAMALNLRDTLNLDTRSKQVL